MIKDQVPAGSDKEKVRHFIEELKVDSLQIGRGDFHRAKVDSLDMAERLVIVSKDSEKVGQLGDRIAEVAGAVIFKAKSDGLFTSDNILIRFYLDREERLIGYTVKMEGSD